jgi:hypothetical protein
MQRLPANISQQNWVSWSLTSDLFFRRLCWHSFRTWNVTDVVSGKTYEESSSTQSLISSFRFDAKREPQSLEIHEHHLIVVLFVIAERVPLSRNSNPNTFKPKFDYISWLCSWSAFPWWESACSFASMNEPNARVLHVVGTSQIFKLMIRWVLRYVLRK